MDFKEKFLKAKSYRNVSWPSEAILNLISRVVVLIHALDDNMKKMFDKNKDLTLDDTNCEFNTKTAIKSIDITVRRVNHCLNLLKANMGYHSPEVNFFLDEVIIPQNFLTTFTKEEKTELNEEIKRAPAYFKEQIEFNFNADQDEFICEGFNKVNLNSVGIYLEAFYENYTTLNQLIECFIEAETKKEKKALRKIIYYQSMLKQLYQLLYLSLLSDEEDIFYAEESSDKWNLFLDHFEIFSPFSDNKAINSYCSFCEWAILMNATFSKGLDKSNNFDRLIQTGKSALKYFVNKNKRIDQYMTFIANPDIKLAKRMINLFENKYIVSAYQLQLASVEINEIIFIPKMEPRLTLSRMKELYSLESIAKVEETKEYPHQKDLYEMEHTDRESSHFYQNIIPDTENFVQVRLLSKVNLPYDFSKSQWRKLKVDSAPEEYPHIPDMLNDINFFIDAHLNKNAKSKIDKCNAITKIVIHIHGGGFITMSSGSHQVYTRTWANKLGIPIFSIDYRLAPEHKYPAAVDDVWQAYVWIVKYSYMQLGITPEKIVLVGDSAGGNLVCAITMLAIQKQFRIPDQIVLCYPAIGMNKHYVFPSILYSLIDPIISANFLSICLDSYLSPECDPERDPFLSTFLADPEILKRFPKTKIMLHFIGSIDPLRDLSYKFTQKLIENDVDVKLYEYTDFPHGFLNYCFPVVGLNEAKVALDFIQSLIDLC